MTLDRTSLQNFLDRAAEVTALVVGDLMLDEYVWGRVERISQEAPVQILDVTRRELRLGGMGNVVNNLLALGCRVRAVSVIGEDPDGATLLQIFADKGLDARGIRQNPARMTTRKTRVLASNQQMLRIDQESRVAIAAADEDAIVAAVTSQLPDCDILFISDYLKGVLTPNLLRRIIDLGREAGLPVVVDPKGDDFGKYRGATLLTPNRREAMKAAGMGGQDTEMLLEAGRSLRRSLDLASLVMTRSEEGMSLFTARGETHLPTIAREVADVSGAGDTVLALLGLGLCTGCDLETAARIANLGAGVVVGRVGTAVARPEELLAEFSAQMADYDDKTKSLPALQEILAGERSRGRKIVFTNGCFDLLHVGHVKYLQAARKLGDLLVLGLNSDDSITRLKGPKRPLIDQDERAQLLAALDCVDYIVIFAEDTPQALIEALRPDVLVKGGDYRRDEVVGREVVERYGGRVELISLVDGKSTTEMINQILATYKD